MSRRPRLGYLLAALAWLLLLVAASGAAPSRQDETGVARFRRQAANKKASKGKKAMEQECLAAHNKWRRMHGAESLEFDSKIASFAQKRANHIAASDGLEFRHPPDLPYGENLAWHSREAKSCSDLVKMWYDEVELYNFNKRKFDHETGHFSQLVWRSTTRVGCATATSSGPKGGIYLVCNYDPPGNFLGEEEENVLPAQRNRKPAGSGPVSSSTSWPTTTTSTTMTTTIETSSIPSVTSAERAVTSSSSGLSSTGESSTAQPAGGLPVEKKKADRKKNKKSKNKKGNKKKKNKEEKDKEKKKSKGKKKRNKKKKKTTTVGPSSAANSTLAITERSITTTLATTT